MSLPLKLISILSVAMYSNLLCEMCCHWRGYFPSSDTAEEKQEMILVFSEMRGFANVIFAYTEYEI